MPRVTFVKAARKANHVAAVGESYYWWKFRFGGKYFSKTYPRPSRLTNSAYIGCVRSLVEQVEDASFESSEYDDFVAFREDIASELRQLGEDADESLQNMPEGLQQGDTGQMLQARYDACEQAADEIEYFDVDGWDEDYADNKIAFDAYIESEPNDPESEAYLNWEDNAVDDPDDGVAEWSDVASEIIDLISACEDCY